MFDQLTQYLYTHKELAVPGVGVFTLMAKDAVADFTSRSIQPPGWQINFRQDKNPVEALQTETLYTWLAKAMHTSKEEAGKQFGNFCIDIEKKLYEGETVHWSGLGTLAEENNGTVFTPYQQVTSPFSDVVAKKVTRENASHQTLVGDKETTTAAMREQLHPLEEEKPRRNIIMWVLLAVAVTAAAIYFFNKGCNTGAAGNQQNVNAAPPQDTYKLR